MPRGVYPRSSAGAAEQPAEPDMEVEAALSPRASEMRRERRRRDDGDLDRMANMKLAIPRDIEEQAKREGKVLRWILDSRMGEANADDWDAVEGVTQVQANPNSASDERMVLCSKYKDWHQADQRRDDLVLDEREKAMMAGQVQDGSRSSEGLRVPRRQTNRITREKGL